MNRPSTHGQELSKNERLLGYMEEVLRDASALCEDVRSGVLRVPILEADTSGSSAALIATRRRFNARWLTALNTFQERAGALPSGSRALESEVLRLQNEWHRIIRQNWEEAWKSGYRSRGRLPPSTSRQVYAISPQLKAEVERQLTHASRFAQELASGDLRRPVVYVDGRTRPRMSVGNRSQLYSRAINGAFQWGAVDGGLPGERIWWRLGACDHCTDCPALAASGPYTRNTLPTVPGQGLTRCSHNCCCILVFKAGPIPRREAPEDLIADVLGPPQPLPGFRAPSGRELTVILDLEARMNFARRKMAQLRGTEGAKEWMTTRSRLNGQLIDFMEARNIYWTPRFSVPEVIDGLDITMPNIDSMMLRGLDGFTVHAAEIPKLMGEIKKSMAELEALLTAAGVTGAVPHIPELEEILRVLGLMPDEDL